jgi:hypothetical protein
VKQFRRSRRFADQEDKKSGRERIQRAAVTDASQAEDAARHCDDVVRGPALWLVDREESGVQAIPSATG